jgi:hypothetical protein
MSSDKWIKKLEEGLSWRDFVKLYTNEHPGVKYSEAILICSKDGIWNEYKQLHAEYYANKTKTTKGKELPSSKKMGYDDVPTAKVKVKDSEEMKTYKKKKISIKAPREDEEVEIIYRKKEKPINLKPPPGEVKEVKKEPKKEVKEVKKETAVRKKKIIQPELEYSDSDSD